jgi:hypothetical protein
MSSVQRAMGGYGAGGGDGGNGGGGGGGLGGEGLGGGGPSGGCRVSLPPQLIIDMSLNVHVGPALHAPTQSEHTS